MNFGSSICASITLKGFLLTGTWVLLSAGMATGQGISSHGLPFVTNFSPQEYEAHAQNWDILQDEEGIIYFANSQGLLEYDGQSWHNTRHDAVTTIRGISMDSAGRLFVASAGEIGYYQRDERARWVYQSLMPYVPEQYAKFNDVWTVHATEQGVFFQAREYIFHLTEQSDEADLWKAEVWESEYDFMYAFYVDGTYYVHQRSIGLMKLYEGDLVTIAGTEVLGTDRMNVMIPLHGPEEQDPTQRRYLLAMFRNGIYVMQNEELVPFESDIQEIAQSFFIYKGTGYGSDRIILSTVGAGIVIIDHAGNVLQKLDKADGLADNSAYTLYIDRDDMLWMGFDNGIGRIDLNSPLTVFNEKHGASSILSIERHEGNLYLGTSNGLLRENAAAGVFEQISQIPINQVFELISFDDELIVPTDGLYSIYQGTVYSIRSSDAGEFQASTVYRSLTHPDILFTGLQNGCAVFRRIGQRGTAPRWRYLGKIPGVTENVWNLAEELDGRLWIGTQSRSMLAVTGLALQNDETIFDDVRVHRYDEASGLPSSISNPFQIGDHVYFPGTEGIFVYDRDGDRFYKDTSFNLDQRSISFGGDPTEYTMEDDHLGRIWLNFGGESALAIPRPDGKYDIETTQFLPFADNPAVDIYAEENGITWFGNFEALIQYNDNIKKDYDRAFTALIRSATSNGTALEMDELSPVLQYDQNSILFAFAAPFYDQEDKTMYQTYLEGFDKDWSDWHRLAQKEYTNLPEGSYTFHVKARNIYKKEGNIASYPFEVLPPWYRTWWGYLMWLGLASGLILAFIRWRTAQFRDRSVLLEKEVADRTKEIQSRIEELSVINNVQKGLVEKMDMESIYHLVGDQLRELFDANTLVIRTFDTEKGIESYNYAIEKGQRLFIEDRPFDSFAHHLLASKESILINTGFKEFIQSFSKEEALEGEVPKSAIFSPMIVDNKTVGNISLQNVDQENAFSPNDVSLLATLCNSMSIALENVRLFEKANESLRKAEKRASELAVINRIQEGLVKQVEIKGILQFVGESLQDVVDAQTIVISTFDHDSGTEEFNYATRNGQPFHIKTKPFNGFAKHIIAERRPIIVNEGFEDYINQFVEEGDGEWYYPKAGLFVPIMRSDVAVGNVSLQNLDKENAYSESDLHLIATIVNSVSVALHNARLFEETQLRAAEMDTVNRVSQAISKKLELDQLIHLVGENVRELFSANIVYVALHQKESGIVEFPYGYGDDFPPLKIGEGLTSAIILSGQSQLINEEVDSKYEELGIENIGAAAASYLGVPIPMMDEVIGVISVQSTEKSNRFNDSDQHLLETIASNVGIAIYNARLYEEAERSRSIAEEANEAKTAFLSTVSHELRTPLTSVLGFAKIIKKRLEDKLFPQITSTDTRIQKTMRQVSENLDVVVSEGQRLTKLINDVLDLAKIEAGKIEWHMNRTRIQDVAERAIAATTALFTDKGLTLTSDIDEDIPYVTADMDKLIQVVVNLLSNAVKFTEQGTVHCAVQQVEDEVVVSVRDSGIGIAEDDLPRVFEKFKQVGDTLTDKPQGTGLGLPISREIIEYHGGRIWVESELAQGSTFSFSLPLQQTKAHTRTTYSLDDLLLQIENQFASGDAFPHLMSKTILVADDEDHIRELLFQELSNVGYQVIAASDGKEALTKIRQNEVDLVILDVMMPEMNGFDVAAILKNDPETKKLPIIILSIVEDKKRGYGIGIDQYMTKPIDMEELLNAITRLLGQGKSMRKVIVVDEDVSTVNTLLGVLKEKGYEAVESNGKELMEKAIADKPDIIILKSTIEGQEEHVKSLRLKKGMEDVLFLVYE